MSLIIVLPLPHDLLPEMAGACRAVIDEQGYCPCFEKTCDFCGESSCKGIYWTPPEQLRIWVSGMTEEAKNFLVPICPECFSTLEEEEERQYRPFGLFRPETRSFVHLTTRHNLTEMFILMLASGSLETLEMVPENPDPGVGMLFPMATSLCWENLFIEGTISWNDCIPLDLFLDDELQEYAENVSRVIEPFPQLTETLGHFFLGNGYPLPELVFRPSDACIGA